jgi:Family of unknown function (DUF6084)
VREIAGQMEGQGPPYPRPREVETDRADQGGPETAQRPDEPGLRLAIAGVRAVPHAAAPTLSFTLRVDDDSGLEVFMAGLSVQIQIEPAKRTYDAESKAKLTELFGDPHRWTTTAQRMHWTSQGVLLGSFTGSTTAQIEVLCNYDVELAAAKYFHSVTDGEIPLAFHFNGSVYYAGGDGRLQVVQVPWDTSADFKLPLSVWKEMIDSYYPYRGWVSVHRDTLDALQRLKARRGAPTLDAAIIELLAKDSLDE